MHRTVLVSVALLLVLSTFLYLQGGITGYIILPADVQGRGIVIDYLKQTPQFNTLEKNIIGEPQIENTYLCSIGNYDAKICKDLKIKEKIEKFGWDKTHYWYASFSGALWENQRLYNEFLVRGSDGVIMDYHIGQYPQLVS